jgi:hypothetical protein
MNLNFLGKNETLFLFHSKYSNLTKRDLRTNNLSILQLKTNKSRSLYGCTCAYTYLHMSFS